jgi:hypothetical protein
MGGGFPLASTPASPGFPLPPLRGAPRNAPQEIRYEEKNQEKNKEIKIIQNKLY